MSLALRTGERFAGDFEVVQRLSRGGMGAVYVVQQLSTGARRALKVMHAELVVDARSRERFAAEAKVSARIRSEHVVEVVAAGVEERDGEPVPWMAMELLEGADLDALVKEHGALPAAEVREIFEQIGHALSDAHDQGIIHRDLKPANIFMARSRRRGAERIVKILDFGIARIADANATSATVTSAIGSPIWMAPEQAQTGARLKPATDVWALGLIAFYLLTGRSYWLEANGPSFNLSGLLVEVMTKPMPPPSTRAAELGVADVLPPGVDGWFAQAVVRDPAGRFGDAESAVAALVSVLAEAGSAAPSDARRAEGSAPRVAATERLDSDSARPSGPSSAPGVVAPTEQLDSPAAHRSGPSSAPGVVAPTEQLDSLPPSTAAPAEPTPQRTAPTEQPERTPAPGAAFESEPRAVHPTEQLAPSPTSKLPSAAGPGGERTPAPVDHASPDPDAPISLPLTRGHSVGKALVVALILSVVVGVGVLVYVNHDAPVEASEGPVAELVFDDPDGDSEAWEEEITDATASLAVDRPGPRTVTEADSIEVAGAVGPSVTVTIDGEEVEVHDGRFFTTVTLDELGEQTIVVVAQTPNQARSVIRREVRRVESLEDAAASFDVNEDLTYAHIARNPAAYRGQSVAFEGEVYNVYLRGGETTLQMLAEPCLPDERCPLWVSHPSATDAEVGSRVRVLGTIAGEQQFRAQGGQIRTVPRVDAAFLLDAPGGRTR